MTLSEQWTPLHDDSSSASGLLASALSAGSIMSVIAVTRTHRCSEVIITHELQLANRKQPRLRMRRDLSRGACINPKLRSPTWWWEKFGVGRIFFFSNVLRSLEKLCVLSQRYLRSLVKPVEFGQTLPVYFTACSGSYYGALYGTWWWEKFGVSSKNSGWEEKVLQGNAKFLEYDGVLVPR